MSTEGEATRGLSVEAQLQALQRLALALGHPGGPDLYPHLVRALAQALQVAAVFVAVFADERRSTMRALAAWLDGRMLPSFEYPLAGSPCEKVTGRAFRYVVRGVRAEMPPDEIFAQVGMDSYAAYPLNDSAGRPLGLVAAMDRQPIANSDAAQAEAILKIVAVRLVAELERASAEQALQRSAASYRAIFEAAEDPIFIHEWDSGRILDVNPKACATYGYTRHEMLQLPVDALSSGVPPYTADDAHRWMQLAKDDRCPPFEWHRRNKDGSLHWDEVRLKPVTIDGRPHVLAVTREITERKAALQALRSREEQYRAIFDSSVDPMVLWNRRLEVVDVNAAFLRVTGFARDQVLGLHWSQRADHEDLRKLLPLIEGALAGREQRAVERVARADGTPFDIELRYLPVAFAGEPHALGIGRDVTEQLERERVLQRSEAQYRGIFNASADALVLRAADFGIVDVNATYEQMSGYRRDEVLGVDRVLANPPEDGATIRALHARALAGETITLRTQLVRRDGRRYELELRGVPVEHAGRPHVLYIGRDISQAVQAEKALRASEEQYRAIFNASADVLTLWNSQYRRVDVNPAYERLYGWTRDEVIGRGFDFPPYSHEHGRLREQLLRRALAGETVQAEHDVVTKDGQRRRADVLAIPFRHGGEPHVLVITRDITERTRAETQLRASEEQYRAIFNASADALMLWDSSLKRVDVNPAHQKIFGYARDEVVGRAFEGLDWPPEMVQQRLAMVQRALAGEASRVELPSLRKGGERIITELRTIPFQHRGEPHVLQIARDVTGQRAAQAERSALEAQLRQAQKMEAIGQLTGGIAHDFNNILTSVIGYLVLAQERSERLADATLVRQLGSAQAAAQRARDLIAQMLAFARRQRGDRRVIALAPLVRQALQLLRSTLPASIALDDAALADAAALPPVRADAVQIEQVLFNLCINARDAMPRGGRITVRLQAQRGADTRCASCGSPLSAGRWLRLGVSDSGSGIDPEVVPRMFEPFFTTKDVGRGSGMGLAMVHGIVHEHEGHIVVDTAPGRGSTFHVLLPAADGAVDAPVAQAPDVAPGAPLAGRVMVVDDEPMVAAFMTELLEGWGLQVLTLGDALAAARWLEDGQQALDLLITDQTMPQMTGLDLAHHASVLRPALPVLLYSGNVEGLDDDALRRAGVRARLDKPVDPARLQALLRQCLENAAAP